jgi:hypothetical protein
MLTPLIIAFQASYPKVRVQVLVRERMADLIAEGVDLAFRLGGTEGFIAWRAEDRPTGIGSKRARLRTFDLSIVHVWNRHISKPCRLFREFAAQMTPALFPSVPT